MNIFVSTSNKYLHLLKPFMFLFNKFWSEDQPVTILGYKKPEFELEKNFKFFSLGEDDNVNNWSSDLRRYFELEYISEEPFIYLMEDCLITEKVNLSFVKSLENVYHQTIGKLGRILLSNDVKGLRVQSVFPHNLVEICQDENWRISTSISLWDKRYWLKYLISGRTPWEFEVEGSKEAKNDGWHILAMKDNYPSYFTNGISRHDNDLFKIDFNYWKEPGKRLDQNIINEMIEKDIIKKEWIK